MKELDRIAKRIGVLRGKSAYKMIAILRPVDNEYNSFNLSCNIIKNGIFVECKGSTFPSRKHAMDYVNALMQEYNILENDVKFLNIVGTREGYNGRNQKING